LERYVPVIWYFLFIIICYFKRTYTPGNQPSCISTYLRQSADFKNQNYGSVFLWYNFIYSMYKRKKYSLWQFAMGGMRKASGSVVLCKGSNGLAKCVDKNGRWPNAKAWNCCCCPESKNKESWISDYIFRSTAVLCVN